MTTTTTADAPDNTKIEGFMSTRFVFSRKTDRTKSSSNIDCIHLIRDRGEFAYVVAPTAAFEHVDMLSMRTLASDDTLSAKMVYALEMAHRLSVGKDGTVPVGRVKRLYANDVDIMYLDDFDKLVQSRIAVNMFAS